ncbi:hypothetical protein JAAARDRAFT_200864 [Jaapia argillacea MUCL 33604]|uniref:Uncharacterized protein n=1 Tax=Jaapia argillacea MUCL 33604 TaxID=933084 RepID=A0A067PEL7_9AGAM|nr:hypothetical protein JAAARDRAFT_200864 [Jaapia argillacea MUCL 33604]
MAHPAAYPETLQLYLAHRGHLAFRAEERLRNFPKFFPSLDDFYEWATRANELHNEHTWNKMAISFYPHTVPDDPYDWQSYCNQVDDWFMQYHRLDDELTRCPVCNDQEEADRGSAPSGVCEKCGCTPHVTE